MEEIKRVNEIKRVYFDEKCYAITEYLINKQNNFSVEDIDEQKIIGISFNVRGALRIIIRERNRKLINLINEQINRLKAK